MEIDRKPFTMQARPISVVDQQIFRLFSRPAWVDQVAEEIEAEDELLLLTDWVAGTA